MADTKRSPQNPGDSIFGKSESVAVDSGLSADHTLAANSEPKPGESLDDAIARIRQIRKPFGTAMSQKLYLPPRIGYHRHWFNDVAGRVDEAKATGWSHVKKPDGTPTKRVVGTGRDNGVLWAYAMELPEVFWEEEQSHKHKIAQDKVDAIKKKIAVAQAGQAQSSDQGKFYNPHEDRGSDPIQVTKG